MYYRYLFKLIIFAILCFIPASHFSESKSTIEITATGDIFISQRLIHQHQSLMKKIHLNGDIVFGNFEGAIGFNLSDRQRMNYKLLMPTSSITFLKNIGYNALSLSNNHSYDDGPDSYQHTYDMLKKSDFSLAGYEDNGEVIYKNGLTIRLIGFNFQGNNNVNNISAAVKRIKSFQEDLIIVSAHMGDEGGHKDYLKGKVEFFNDEPRGNIQEFSRSLIDAGADLIIGHGPHFLRKIEIYKKRVIMYSLGNFIFDYPGVEKYPPYITCSVTLSLNKKGEIIKGRLKNYKSVNGIPSEDKSNTAFLHLLKDTGIERNTFMEYFNTNHD